MQIVASPERRPRAGSGARAVSALARILSFAALLVPAVTARQAAGAGTPPAAPYAGRDDRSGSEWYSRAMDLHGDRRWDAAIAAFQKAIAAGYREETATYNIACAYARKGDDDRAFEWLGRAIEAGFDVSAYLDDEDLESLHGDPRWTDLKAKARVARAGKDRERVTRAVARFDRLMARQPRDGRPLFDVGRELLRVAEYDRAALAFVAAAEAGRREGTSLYNAACARALANKSAEALDLLERALEAGFDDPDHMSEDDDLDAIRSDPRFARLMKDARELSLDGFPSLGARLLRSERVAEAREAATRFERYLKSHPKSGRAWSNLGFVSLAAERPQEAVRAFGRALDLGYRVPTTAYNLACAHARLREKDAAFQWLDKAIEAGFRDADRIADDDDLSSLRRDPRFRKAISKAKAKAGARSLPEETDPD